jgi:hypothetical protein
MASAVAVVIKTFKRRYELEIVTVKGIPKLDKEFPNSSSAVKVDDHHLNSSAVLRCAFVLCVTQSAF